MNLDRLKQAEGHFLDSYPGGFSDPAMAGIRKRHNVNRMVEMAQENFVAKKFRYPDEIVADMVRIVGRSSMISLFEKPRFRDFARGITPRERNALAAGLKARLHDDEQRGFEQMLAVLASGRLAKWSLISILPMYFRPQDEVFVKPTTTKGVINHFQLDSLHYRPQPSWAFYAEYRRIINDMKTRVDESLSPNSAAFTGFLMMTLGG